MSSLNDFPPEILWEILNYLDIKQLFNCRLVNSQWNEVCSSLLIDESNHSRNPIQWNLDIFERAKVPSESSKSLQTLCHWFSPSTFNTTTIGFPCIFCPLSFARIKLSSGADLKNESILEFFSTVGPFVKSLELEFCNTEVKTVAQFWTSINQYMPNVEELLIHFGFLLLPKNSNSNSESNSIIPINQNVTTNKLNSIPNSNLNNNKNPPVQNNNSTPPSLNKSIKKLRLSWDYRFPTVVNYFLQNAPNCQQVIKCDSMGDDFWKVRDLKFWWSMKKLELIKNLEINSVSFSENHLDFYLYMLKDLHLLNLHLNCQYDLTKSTCRHGDGHGHGNGSMRMLNFIDAVYKTSQDSVTSLRVTISDSSPMEVCPGHYFRGVQLLNVHTVSICGWSGGDVQGMENLMTDISQLCPNVRCLKIDRHINQYFTQVIPIVWTHFSKIQSLKIDMNVETLENNFSIVDSTFSGYPLDSIKEKNKNKEKSAQGIRFTRSEVKFRRDEVQMSSILDLKDLRSFQLRFYTPDKLYESCNWKEKLSFDLRRLLFVQMLPSHLRENPLTLQINDLNGRFIPIFPT